jgi:CO/xanthine dehydrogenase Mo-binding subunit
MRFSPAADANGVTIWSPTQHPVRAPALSWRPLFSGRSRGCGLSPPIPAADSAAKGWPKVEPLMAWLAIRLGQPVRLVLTLEETFQAARRTSARIHARTGFASDGRIIFQDIQADFLLGAYADIGTRVVSKASYSACGPVPRRALRASLRERCSHTRPQAPRLEDSARRRRHGLSNHS